VPDKVQLQKGDEIEAGQSERRQRSIFVSVAFVTRVSAAGKNSWERCPVFHRAKLSVNFPALPRIPPHVHHKSTTTKRVFSQKLLQKD
jgi:hypothetical protein